MTYEKMKSRCIVLLCMSLMFGMSVQAPANDFMMMFWVCVPMLLLLFFMKRPRVAPTSAAELAME